MFCFVLLVEECGVVTNRMQKRRDLLQEGQTFSPFDRVSNNGLQCMREAQRKDGRILAVLNASYVYVVACLSRAAAYAVYVSHPTYE